MEPQLPTPPQSPEMGPPPLRPEEQKPPTAEVYARVENQEVHEQISSNGDGPGPSQPLPTTPVASIAPPLPTNPSQTMVVQDTNPAVAADEDLIEKEWVEKAKKIIADNKNDPYLQKQAVSQLQADYLNKRYGKSVKLPEEA